MKRGAPTWIAGAAVLVAACGTCDRPRSNGTQGRDTAAPSVLDASIDETAEPKGPPPAPTIKPPGKGDCRTAYAPRPTRDPNPMCLVRGGTFQMGSPDGEGDDDEHPQHPVAVKAFYLDQFEVTWAQVAHFLNARGGNACESADDRECFFSAPEALRPFLIVRQGRFLVSPDAERLPTSSASWEGARRYCAWAGKRLPTEAEWEYAARHDPATGKDLRYPWGDEFEPERANCRAEDCEVFFDNPYSRMAPPGTFDGVGRYRDGSSPWGVHDLAGNADEWTSDCHQEYAPAPHRARPDSTRCDRTVRSATSSSIAESMRSTERVGRRAGAPMAGIRCALDAMH